MTTEQIINDIAKRHDLTREELLEKTQSAKRRQAIKELYAALREAGFTVKQVSEVTGRDASTVIRVVRDYKRELELRK